MVVLAHIFNLESLYRGSQERSLIRLYDFERTDVIALRDLYLATGMNTAEIETAPTGISYRMANRGD